MPGRAVALQDVLSWAAPIAAICVVSVSLSLSVPLYALLLERMGASGTVIGLNSAAAAIAMVASAPVLPMVMARTGLVPLMLCAIAVMALAMAAIPLWPSVGWWSVLRFAWGAAATVMFFASEYWLVAIAPDALRGRLIAIYSMVLAGSYMLGPAILNLTGPDSWLTFAVPTAIILAAAAPVLLGRRSAPAARAETPVRALAPLRFFRSDPLILWGVVLFGMIEFGGMALLTNWGVRSGYAEPAAVSLVFWLAFGSLAFQLPIGWAADRFERRRLLALAAIGSAAAPLGMLALSTDYPAVAAGAVVWGGTAVALYTLALTELGARYRGAVLAEGNAAVILAYGVGALISPVAFGTAMEIVRPNGLLWFAGLAALAYLALAVVRMGHADGASLDKTRIPRR
jgi:MFS family permease